MKEQISNAQNDITTKITLLEHNINQINESKNNFENGNNNIIFADKEKRRNFKLKWGSFGDFQWQKLREQTLHSSGVKKLTFKTSRIGKSKELNIDFDYTLANGLSADGEYQEKNKTLFHYHRDKEKDKLIISTPQNEESKQDHEENQNTNKDEKKNEYIPDIPERSPEKFTKQKLNISIEPKERTIAHQFQLVFKNRPHSFVFQQTITYNNQNYLIIKPWSLSNYKNKIRAVPVRRSTQQQTRIRDIPAIKQDKLLEINTDRQTLINMKNQWQEPQSLLSSSHSIPASNIKNIETQ